MNPKSNLYRILSRLRRIATLSAGHTAILSLFVVTAGGQTSSSGPGHHTQVDYRYYPVSGSTASELLEAMVTGGPVRGNQRFFALTESLTGFTYKTRQTQNGCKLEHVEVNTEVVVRLPQWKDVDAGSAELASRWKVFEVALQNHEMWHIASARKTTRKIHEALTSLSAADCTIAENRSRTIAQQILDAGEKENIEYDRNTGHGRSQGASWPP